MRLAAVISPHRSHFTLLHINIYSHPTPAVKTLLSKREMKRRRSALKSGRKGRWREGKTLLINPTAHKHTRVMKPAEAAAPIGATCKKKKKKCSSFPFPTANTNVPSEEREEEAQEESVGGVVSGVEGPAFNAEG